MTNTPKLQCPTCNKAMIWSTDNPSRPFCSERCRLIDLGAWASEEYQISDPKEQVGLPADFNEFDLDDSDGFLH